MGILVPEHFPLSQLKNDEERMVVDAFRDRLTDGWLVMPDVGLAGFRERQVDIVLLHENYGAVVVEVKGHAPGIEGGVWMAHGKPMEPQPFAQAQANAYALRNWLRIQLDDEHLRVEYAVAFPNALSVRGELPPDVHPSQVLTSKVLEHPQELIEAVALHRSWNSPLGAEGMQAVVRVLRPDVQFEWDPEARARLARAKLDQIAGQSVRALQRLDLNRRVAVTGAAGTGKSMLAMGWARRALMRGERVLFTCYNEPLGQEMELRMHPDPRLTVGPFFPVVMNLPGMPTLEVPEDADSFFWDGTALQHLYEHWPKVTARFDTIVIDEAQDMSPQWIDMLQRLLDHDGPRRVLLTADDGQSLYHRGFEVPSPDDGWARCELAYNCRNTGAIARLLRSCFNGAPPPVGGPETQGIRWFPVATDDDVIEQVQAEYDRIVEEEAHDARRVLFATFNRSTRDRLRDEFGFVEWELGAKTAVICETVHRVKGLEFDYVVLVAGPEDRVTDQLLYVGASRAITGLSVVAPPEVARRLGLDRSTEQP